MAGKPKVVRVKIHVPGRGEEAHEFDHCPIGEHSPGERICPIGGGKCNFGLTEVEPPELCPMGGRVGSGPITMTFSVVSKGK